MMPPQPPRPPVVDLGGRRVPSYGERAGLAGLGGPPPPSTLSRPWRSAVPQVIRWLITNLRASAAAQNLTVQVRGGQWIGGGSATEAGTIVIGWPGFDRGYEYPSRSMSEELGGKVATGEGMMEGLGPSINERVILTNVSMVLTGSTSEDALLDAIDTAYANIALLGPLLQPPWIGGAVQQAILGNASDLYLVQQRRGVLVNVAFQIECQGWVQQ